MARVVTSSRRRELKKVAGVTVLKGNAPEMGGFSHFRTGREIAKPTILLNGEQVFSTPTGRTFTVRKLSS